MPIPREDDMCPGRCELLDVLIKNRNDFVAIGNRQGSTWTEVDLSIDYYDSGSFPIGMVIGNPSGRIADGFSFVVQS